MRQLHILAILVALTTLFWEAYSTKLPNGNKMRNLKKEDEKHAEKDKHHPGKKDRESEADNEEEENYYLPYRWQYDQAKYLVSNKCDNYLRQFIMKRELEISGNYGDYSGDPWLASVDFSGIQTTYLGGTEMVKVEVTGHSNNTDVLRSALEGDGITVRNCKGFSCSACIPVIGFMLRVDSIQEIRTVCATAAITNLGSVQSEAPRSMGSDMIRSKFGLSGKGIKIGVMSDSFGCKPGKSIALGDIPVTYTIVKEISDCFSRCGPVVDGEFTGVCDEGRAMMELIADIAPEAILLFRTAADGVNDFAVGIHELAEAGADVIVDDVLSLTEPWFQDGVLAQAADEVVKDYGIPFFSAAGNNARLSWEGAFQGSGLTLFGGEAHQFFDGDVFQKLTFTGQGRIQLNFQWNEPFASASGPPGSASDIDIFLFSEEGLTTLVPVAQSISNNVGADAAEVLAYRKTTSGAKNFYLYIELRDGPEPTRMKWISFGVPPIFVEFDTKSGTSVAHKNAAYTAAIGAADWMNTPRLGVSPAIQEVFTSAGGVPIYHDKEGKRLDAAVLRHTPLVVGPDNIRTTFFPKIDFPFFTGTSAAAPNVAALAALMLEFEDSLTPCDIYKILAVTAHDMDDAATMAYDNGYDFGTGYGFVDAIFAFNYLEQAFEDGGDGGNGGKGNSRKLQGRNRQRRRIKAKEDHRASRGGSLAPGCAYTGTMDRDEYYDYYRGYRDYNGRQRKLRGKLIEPSYGI